MSAEYDFDWDGGRHIFAMLLLEETEDGCSSDVLV
jgi:hypothetical protein